MLNFPRLVSLLATSEQSLAAIRGAVNTFVGHVSDRNARIEKEEKCGRGTWVTVAVSSAEHAFHLGVKTGELLLEKGGVEIG